MTNSDISELLEIASRCLLPVMPDCPYVSDVPNELEQILSEYTSIEDSHNAPTRELIKPILPRTGPLLKNSAYRR